jgi:hydrogenase maturation factor HypE
MTFTRIGRGIVRGWLPARNGSIRVFRIAGSAARQGRTDVVTAQKIVGAAIGTKAHRLLSRWRAKAGRGIKMTFMDGHGLSPGRKHGIR